MGGSPTHTVDHVSVHVTVMLARMTVCHNTLIGSASLCHSESGFSLFGETLCAVCMNMAIAHAAEVASLPAALAAERSRKSDSVSSGHSIVLERCLSAMKGHERKCANSSRAKRYFLYRVKTRLRIGSHRECQSPSRVVSGSRYPGHEVAKASYA